MCYMNCDYENRKGECTRAFNALDIKPCPHEEENDEEERDED